MKRMKTRYCLISIFLLEAILLQAQNHTDTIDYSINARFSPSGGSYSPFLSTANAYDRYSTTPNSLAIWGTLQKDIDYSSIYDYGFGVDMNANISKTEKRFFPEELYLQGKAFFLNAFVGMKREVFGNQDPELSSGGLIWSQNSRPLPKISLESNGYIPLPYTKGYIEVMGGISHGWFTDNTVTEHTLLHHKYAYIRFGGSFPVNISYGLQHVCQWGGTSAQYGTSAVTWSNFKRIFFAESGSSSSPMTEQENALGNHIISQNLGLDVNLNSVKVSLYWQDISEDPPVLRMDHAYNVADGLWGMSVRLPKFSPLNAFAMEYMSTTDQSGPWHDLDGVIYGGADSYYTNGVYPNGWTFHGMTMGNPWLTSPKYNKNGAISVTNDMVRLFYFSGKGEIFNYAYRATVAYSNNYGSPSFMYEKSKKQLSWQIQAETPASYLKNTKISLGLSGDRGTMYGNTFAVLLGITYAGKFIY
jgi:hypothetical protein